MSNDNLNPILNPDCECPTPEVETPSECPAPEQVAFDVSVLPDECGSCDEVIVPAAPAIADLTPTTKCLDVDPAYNYIPAIDKTPGVGGHHVFYELHPACVRPMQLCDFCVSEVTCPEDIGLTIRKGFDNVFSVMPGESAVGAGDGAEKPLLFWVHDSHLERVMSEFGYIKVAQEGNYNEWMPRDCVVNGYVISPAVAFPGDDCFLREMPAIGTIPTVVTEQPVTSVLDDSDDSNDSDDSDDSDDSGGVIVSDVTAPTVTDPGGQSPSPGVPFTIQLEADEANVTWSATGLGNGLSIDSNTGVISGTPLNAGVLSVTVTATDAAGNESDPVVILFSVN